MTRRPPRSKLTDPLFPYRTLFRSWRQTAAHAAGLAQKMQVLPAIEAETAHSFRDHAQLAQRGGSAKSRIWRTTPCVAFTVACMAALVPQRSEEHTSELQSLMRISYAVFCLKKKTKLLTPRKQ